MTAKVTKSSAKKKSPAAKKSAGARTKRTTGKKADIPTSDELQVLLDKLVGEHKTPGVSAAVRNGDNVAVAASGVLNINTGVEVTTDSLFQIGSNTKVFNATLVMQLVDEGKIDLDELAVTYLPEFKLADKKATKQITVRHLLTHTSGIDGGDYIEDFGRGEDALEKYVASLAKVGLVHPIGKYWSYCNAATVVAGRIIEVLTGQYWHEALKSRLLEPLGLTHAVATPEDALLFRTSVGHMADSDNDGAVRVFPSWMLPFATGPAGATMCMSASDLTAFGQFHLNNGIGLNRKRVLSATSAKAMREPQFVDVIGVRQGIGWIVGQQGPFKIIAHGGGTFGQYSTFMAMPEQNVVIASLTNGPSGGAVSAGIVREVMSRVGGEEFAAKAAEAQAAAASAADTPTSPTPEVKIDLANYVGVYERKGLTTKVTKKKDVLVATTTYHGYLAQSPPQKPMTLRPVDATTFSVLNAEGKPSGQATFLEIGKNGRPKYMVIGRIAKRVS